MPHDNMPGGVVARLVTMKVPYFLNTGQKGEIMPGEITALYTEASDKLQDYYTYLTTIQSTLSTDLMIHAQAVNQLAALVCELDNAISSMKHMTSS